jgi:outer membrane biosynthesis protein TonB
MLRIMSLGLALAALLLSGCGRENPRLIPATRAQALTDTVDQIAQRTDGEDCTGAQRAVQQARGEVAELPRRVDADLRANINEWLNHIAEEVPKDCKPAPKETPTPSATPEKTKTPTPTASPEETATPSPTPTETPTPTEVPTVEPPPTGGVIPGDEG